MVVRIAILLDETTQRIDPGLVGNHGNMVGPARQWCGGEPKVLLGLVDVVVAAVNPAFAITSNDMQAPRPFGCPGHFAARNRQGGTAYPASRGTHRGRAIERALRFLIGA